MTPPTLDAEQFPPAGSRGRRPGGRLSRVDADAARLSPMTPEERATLVQEPLGDAGADAEAILERFRTAVLPHAMGNGHPRFFGWVNSPPAPVGIVADFLAAVLNPSCAGGDHAAIYGRAGRRPLAHGPDRLPHGGQHGTAGERWLGGHA